MWIVAFFHVEGSKRRAGKGVSAGLSTCSKSERRHPSNFWKGWSFNTSRSSAIAMLRASSEKKVMLRKRAKIQRWAIRTPPSTFALSFGLRGRAGMTAVL